MRVYRIFFSIAALVMIAAVFPAATQPAGGVAPAPVYVPDYSHQNDPLPGGVLDWDSTSKSVDATNGQDFARFVFAFTNVWAKITTSLETNAYYVTNYTIVTNTDFWHVFTGRKYSALPNVSTGTNVVTVTNSITQLPVTVLNVHPSCGCTTAEVPAMPWQLPPGTNSLIRVNVNLAGKSGTVFKSVNIATDKGKMDLQLKINIMPAPPAPAMTEAMRQAGVAAAKVDRQAVFKGDCASCHAKNLEGKYGQQLYAQACGICHDANPRATMVPDLHNLKDQTSEEFWRAWITAGKTGTLMPAFANSQGGPLNDMQIGSLSVYLNQTIPPHPAIPPPK